VRFLEGGGRDRALWFAEEFTELCGTPHRCAPRERTVTAVFTDHADALPASPLA
jgi:hypothetical protein